jgi:hypothetical protein
MKERKKERKKWKEKRMKVDLILMLRLYQGEHN